MKDWRIIALFLLSFLLTSDVAPNLREKRFLREGETIGEVREGSYILSDYEIRRMKGDYIEFVSSKDTFWAQVENRKMLVEGPLELTVMKSSTFLKVTDINALTYEEVEFKYLGSKGKSHLYQLGGKTRLYPIEPQCNEGTLKMSQGEIREIQCQNTI